MVQCLDHNAEATKLATGTNSSSNSNTTESGQCAIIIFYYTWCPFSSVAAPKFNALGRLYPQLYVIAVDAYHHHSITLRFGVSGVPSIFFLFNGRAVARFNKTEITMDGLFEFIRLLTRMEPNETESLNLTSTDLQGPLVINLENNIDYLYILCCIFCLVVIVYHFLRSNIFEMLKENIQVMWNEAQIVHHEHVE